MEDPQNPPIGRSDPSAPAEPPLLPEPMRQKPVWRTAGGVAGLLAAAGGAFLLLISSRPRELPGATRSHQLEWQQRQAEIEQVLGEGDR